jgi:hypothetical protein
MKIMIIRIIVSAILVAIISGTIVLVIGVALGWNTSTQFSNGFFWASAIMFIFGFISFQGYRQQVTVWPPSNLNPDERSNLLAMDTFRGKNLMIIFGISGLLLFGSSILVSRLF